MPVHITEAQLRVRAKRQGFTLRKSGSAVNPDEYVLVNVRTSEAVTGRLEHVALVLLAPPAVPQSAKAALERIQRAVFVS